MTAISTALLRCRYFRSTLFDVSIIFTWSYHRHWAARHVIIDNSPQTFSLPQRASCAASISFSSCLVQRISSLVFPHPCHSCSSLPSEAEDITFFSAVCYRRQCDPACSRATGSDLSFRGTDRCSVSAVHSVTVRSADSVAATQQELGGKCQEDRESGRHSRAAMRYATYDMLQVPISGVRKPSDANFRERRGSDEMARTASLHDE